MENKTWQDIEQDINNMGLTKKRKRIPEEEKEFKHLKEQIIIHLDTLKIEPCDKGVFRDYAIWADTLNEKVIDFYNEHGVYPNILLANDKTYDKITEIEKDKPENRRWVGEGEPPDDFSGFSAFETGVYILELCINNRLKMNTFRLVYDEDPIFDGEEEPEETVKKTYKKKAA